MNDLVLDPAPADAAHQAAVAADDAGLAQLEGHGHDGHTADDEDEGEHEELGVRRHDVPEADGGERDEAEVQRVKDGELLLPQWQHQAAEKDVGEHHQQDEQQRHIQPLHVLPDAIQVPDGEALGWPRHAVELRAGAAAHQRDRAEQLLVGNDALKDLRVVEKTHRLAFHRGLGADHLLDVQRLPHHHLMAEGVRAPGQRPPLAWPQAPAEELQEPVQVVVACGQQACQGVAHIPDDQQHERDAHHGIEDTHHPARHSDRIDLAVTCQFQQRKTQESE